MNKVENISFSDVSKIFQDNREFDGLFDSPVDLKELAKQGREVEHQLAETLRNLEVPDQLKPVWKGGQSKRHPHLETLRKASNGTQYKVVAEPDFALYNNRSDVITIEVKNRSSMIFADVLQGLFVLAAAERELGEKHLHHYYLYMKSGAIFEINRRALVEANGLFDGICLSAIAISARAKQKEEIKKDRGVVTTKLYHKVAGDQLPLFDTPSDGVPGQESAENRAQFEAKIKEMGRKWGGWVKYYKTK